MSKLICDKCNQGELEDIYLCSPSGRIKMKQCNNCNHIIDYYKEFRKKYPKLISQMIYEENYKELSTKGEVKIRRL